jgi:hypothetical protein
MRAMPRFTIKSLLFLMAVFASFVLGVSENIKGLTCASFVGFGLFVILLFFYAFRDLIAANGARTGEETPGAKKPN